MASPSRRAVGGATATSGLSTISMPTVADGDVVVVAVNSNTASSPGSPSSSGWSQAWAAVTNGSAVGTSSRVDSWWTIWSTGDPTTITWSSAPSTQQAANVSTISGADTTTPVLTAAADGIDFASAANPPAVSHSSADVIYLAHGGGDGKNNSFTASVNYSGASNQSTNNDGPAANASSMTCYRQMTGSTGDDPGQYGGTTLTNAWTKRVTIAIQAPAIATQTGSFTADAVIFDTIAGSLTLDAIVRKAFEVTTFKADAWISSESVVTDSFTADAIVGQTVAGSMTMDAHIHGAQQFRPDGDISAGGWTLTPLWSKIDDDDGTVITSDVAT